MENRTRFIVDVIKEIKKRCGQDFPVQILMNAIEVGLPGDEALSLAEGKEIARIYEAVGADSLHVRSHWAGMHQGSYNQENMFYPEPYIPLKDFPKELDWTHHGALAQVPLAAEIKKVVSLPVMTVGLIDADSGMRSIRTGKADLIGINRRFFADNDWANKVREGRPEDISPPLTAVPATRTTTRRATAASMPALAPIRTPWRPRPARRRRWSWSAPVRRACRPPGSRPLEVTT